MASARSITVTIAGALPPYTHHLARIIEKGARADRYLETRFARPIIWDVEIGEEKQYAENAYFRLRPVAHVATLATIALCAAAYWVGFLSGPFGVRGLVLFTTILVTGWVIGMATGFFGALASRGG